MYMYFTKTDDRWWYTSDYVQKLRLTM